jgi:mRNA interferase HigB
VRIIKASTILQYAKKHTAAKSPLSAWMLIVSRADWHSMNDVRRTYPHADAVKVSSERIVTVFNIAGNNYRLVVAIHYNTQRVFVRDFLTHAEYSKQTWKDRH